MTYPTPPHQLRAVGPECGARLAYPHGFREAMDDLGANNRNGTTNGDRTNFFEDVPTSALERTLYLEADRMGFLGKQINAEMLERERGVVQNEKRQGENQPYGRVFDRLVEKHVPGFTPLQLEHHRQHGGPERRVAAGCPGVVQEPTTVRTTACSHWPETSRPSARWSW